MINDMIKYKTSEIPQDSYFSESVFLDDKFIVSIPGMPFNEDLLKSLEDWEVSELYSKGANTSSFTSSIFMEDEPEILNEAFSNITSRLAKAEEFYTSLLGFSRNLFVHATVGNEIDYNHVAKRVKTICDFVKDDKTMLLRVQKNAKTNQDDNYLASHSVKSTILSIVIGNYFKLPIHRLIELGVAALVHEIGMVELPQKIYLSKNQLKPLERKAIASHPARGYNLLRSYGFPLSVMLAALEHHERDNGSGYPRNLTGDKISLYAKIIAVTCSCEAISAKRPHKAAKDDYTGMLELLRNEGKQYDDTVIRALVYSLSIYPVGLYVLLSNDSRAQVIDVNPSDPRFPIVEILGETAQNGRRKIIYTSQDDISITRPLTGVEIESEINI